MKKGQKSVFIKMLITFLLIITPLYFFNFSISLLSRNSIRKEIEESTKSKINFYVDSIQKEFDGIMLMQQSLLNDNDLNQVSTDNVFLSQYEKNRALLAIQKQLRNIKNLSSYIEEANVYIPLIDKKITTNLFEDFEPQEFEKVVQMTQRGKYPFYSAGNQVYINLAPDNKIMINGSYIPIFIISIQVSKDQLEQMLQKISTYEQSGAVLISTGNGINASSAGFYNYIDEIKTVLPENLNDFGEAATARVKIENQYYITVFKVSTLMNTVLVAYVPEKQLFGMLSIYTVWIWILTLMAVAVVMIFASRVKRMIAEPLKKLIEAFDKLDEGDGDLNISVNYKSNDEFKYLYIHFNEIVKKFGDLIKQVYEQRIRTKEAELKQLQYQINPHFLYNSIYIIHRLSKAGDLDGTSRLALYLGNYYRFVSRNPGSDVPLENEVAHAQDYIGIQSFRFSRRITVTFEELPEECKNIMVPRLILQPVIENAYKYGLEDKDMGGKLKISFKADSRSFSAYIEDNGEHVDSEKLQQLQEILDNSSDTVEGTGLINVHRRLQMKFGDQSGLFLFISEMGGLGVEIRIVFKEEEALV